MDLGSREDLKHDRIRGFDCGKRVLPYIMVQRRVLGDHKSFGDHESIAINSRSLGFLQTYIVHVSQPSQPEVFPLRKHPSGK